LIAVGYYLRISLNALKILIFIMQLLGDGEATATSFLLDTRWRYFRTIKKKIIKRQERRQEKK